MENIFVNVESSLTLHFPFKHVLAALDLLGFHVTLELVYANWQKSTPWDLDLNSISSLWFVHKIHFRRSRKDTDIIIKSKKNKERHSFAISCHYLVTSKYVWSWLNMPLLKLAFFPKGLPLQDSNHCLCDWDRTGKEGEARPEPGHCWVRFKLTLYPSWVSLICTALLPEKGRSKETQSVQMKRQTVSRGEDGLWVKEAHSAISITGRRLRSYRFQGSWALLKDQIVAMFACLYLGSSLHAGKCLSVWHSFLVSGK